VCDRRAEDRHDCVADEFLHLSAARFDLGAQASEVRGEDRTNVLWIETFGARGEADEIGEEHRDDPAFLHQASGARLQRRTAGVAEAGAGRVLLPTVRADAHSGSVRRCRR
jgi:hypothetical protein